MALPAAVQRQAEQADKFYNQDPQPTPGDQNPQPAPVAQPTPQPTPAPEHIDWEHRYKVLQGKYSAEVPQLHTQVKQLQAQIAQLMNGNPSPAPQANNNPAPARQEHRNVRPEEIEEYGEDLHSFMARTARDAIGNVDEKMALNRFESALYAAVPDWQQINAAPQFAAWLENPDAITGLPRRMELQQAFEAMQPGPVIQGFRAFLADAQKPTPQVSNVPSLESQASPGRSRAGEAPQQQKFYTSAEIRDFYKMLATGKYRGTKQEADAIEADIARAYPEGRVRN